MKSNKEIKEKMLEELTVLDNAMYFVNSQLISLQWIGLKHKPTEEEISGLNEVIGKWIKKVRELKSLLENEKDV